MPVEDIAVGLLGGIARLIAWFIMEIFFQTICWEIGWATLKALTIGSYPKPETKVEHVIVIGFIVLLIPIIGFTIYAS